MGEPFSEAPFPRAAQLPYGPQRLHSRAERGPGALLNGALRFLTACEIGDPLQQLQMSLFG